MMKIETAVAKVGYQIYILPTIKVTYDKTLFGHRNIEFWWLKWGFEIIFGESKHPKG